MRVFAGIIGLALPSVAAFAQTAEAPKFDIADVHASVKSPTNYMSGGVLRGGRFEIRRATMVDLIRVAYSVDDEQKIQGGPGWLERDRFDIVAKAPPRSSSGNVTQETSLLMLRELLAERFKLVLHTEDKPMPANVLSLGKGKPKMREANGAGTPGCQGRATSEDPATRKLELVCRNLTMEAFTSTLRNYAGNYLAGPVVDRTGLEGAWDFEMQITPRTLLGQAGADGITIFDAVDKQLGLKLEPQKIPVPVIVVDSVNQKPTDNPPGVTTSLPPPPPAEFEVASIKPSAPGAERGGQGLMPGGRIEMRGYSLVILIQIAWGLDFPDTMIADAPKFLDTAKFDVVAKASSVTSGPANAQQIEIDDLRLMFRNLLIERFKMKVHMEDRPVPGYVLTAAKPKLTKADPANRTRCFEGPGADGKDPRIANPMLSRLFTCQNTTIAQLGEQLSDLASGYVHTPVLDSTGLTGAYDFTVSFSPNLSGDALNPRVGGNSGEPDGALTLSEAINRQLGLKMELQKRPMPVLVIDHIEEKPTDD